MFATTVRIHRLGEMNVRRIVMRNDAARPLFGDFRFRTRPLFIQQRVLPAVVFGMMSYGFEPSLRIGSGATTFDCGGNICHLRSMRLLCLNCRDTQG